MRVITFFACFVLVYANIAETEFAPNTVTEGEKRTVIITVNQPVTLSCSFKINDGQSHEWKKINGTVEGKISENKSNNEVQMSLDIASVTQEDEGDYQCIAVGSNNQNRTGDISLRVATVSDVTMNVVNVSESLDSVYLTWTVNEYEPEYYRIETLTNAKQFWSENIPGNESHYDLTELQSNVKYRFRLYAVYNDNQIHIGPYSDWVDITRRSEMIFIPIVKIVNSTKDSITIQWNRPSNESGHQVNEYKIFVNDDEPVPNVSSTDAYLIHELKNLNCSANYTIEVEACKTVSELNGKSLPVHGRTLNCTINSAAVFGPQMNMTLVIMLALYLSTKYHA